LQGAALASLSFSRHEEASSSQAETRESMPLRLLSAVTLSALLAALGSSAARADFRLCNNTNARVSVSLAYTDGQRWVSEGWWNLKPSACETLLRGPLAAQYYYVYAMDERGGEWKGKAFMCTRDREFHIDGREDCFVRGFDRTGFFEIDTGKDAKNWTVQLTDTGQARNP
jgi:uncharacterized membrane protein